jgi:hypothetical protein
MKAKWKQDADLCRSLTMCPLRVAEHRQQNENKKNNSTKRKM